MVRALLGLTIVALATAPAAAQIPRAGGPPLAEVEAIWSGFWSNIILGDIQAARGYLYSRHQPSFRGEEIKTDLQDVARQMSYCRIVSPPVAADERQALYDVTCDHRGEHAETFLFLLRDVDGAWRIGEF